MEVLHKIEGVQTNSSDKPLNQITITDCGEIKIVKDDKEEKELKEKLQKEADDKKKEQEENEPKQETKKESRAEYEARKRDETKEAVSHAVKQGIFVSYRPIYS